MRHNEAETFLTALAVARAPEAATGLIVAWCESVAARTPAIFVEVLRGVRPAPEQGRAYHMRSHFLDIWFRSSSALVLGADPIQRGWIARWEVGRLTPEELGRWNQVIAAARGVVVA